MHISRKLLKPTLSALIVSVLLITMLSIPKVSGDLPPEGKIDGREQDPLVLAGYRPRYPYEGSPFIQTPSPAPEGVEMVTHSGDDDLEALSSSPTRRTYELYYSYSVLEAYVDTDAGALSTSEWDLLKRFCDDFVNISYGRTKEYFDPLDKVDDVVFYVYNIDGQSGIGGYYQPGTHYFFVDRADLSWAGEIIAHEFQHYVHRQYDPYESLWIDEGFADLSAYLTYGFGSGNVVSQHALYYLKYQPTAPLVVTDSTFQSNIVHYGSSFLFALYMMEHYGGKNWTRTLVKTGQRGTSAVDTALMSLGSSDRFHTVFHNWMVATRINDDHAGEDNEFSYEQKSIVGYSFATNLQGSFDGIPRTKSGNLNGYGVVSYRFSSPPDPDGEYRLKVTLRSGTPDAALYEESSPPRTVRDLAFSGDTATFDMTEWGSKYDTFQLIMSSTSASEFVVNLDILDIDPPVTDAIVQPGLPDGEDGWYVTSPRITLSTEAGANRYYQFNNGDIMTYDAPIYVPEGIYNISYWSVDSRDNVEARRYLQFKVDLSTPVSAIDVDPEKEEGKWYTTPPTVYLYTTHLYSEIYYTWGNRDLALYSDPLTAPEGVNSLVWYAVDQAGNREMMRDKEFMVDTISPEVELSIYPKEPDGENGWYVSQPRITISSEEDAVIYYSIDGGPEAPYDQPIEISEGEHELRVTAFDQAGNKALEGRYQLKVDTHSPSLYGEFDKFEYSDENSSMWMSILPTLALWSQEEKVDITYTINGGDPLKYSKDITINQGESEIYVYGKDRAGNGADPLHFLVRVDSMKPNVEHSIDALLMDGWYRENEVMVSLDDISSGDGSPVSISYRWDHEEWAPYRSSFSMREGIHVLQYSAVDSAGNAMEPRTIDLKKDSVLPTAFISASGLLENGTLEAGMNITLDMSDSLDAGGIRLYRVDFGDGNETSWSGSTDFVYSYYEAGTYTITGWVQDNAGNERSTTYRITVWKEKEAVVSDGNGSGDTFLLMLGGLFLLVLLLVFLIQMVLIMKKRRQTHAPKHHIDPRWHLHHRNQIPLPPAHLNGEEGAQEGRTGHIGPEVPPPPAHPSE